MQPPPKVEANDCEMDPFALCLVRKPLKLTFTLFTVAEGLSLNLECPDAAEEVFLTNHHPVIQQSTNSPKNKVFDAVSSSHSCDFIF